MSGRPSIELAAGDPVPYGTARRALAAIPGAVVLVAASDGAARSCATGTAMYVSFVPPLVAVALHPGSRTAVLAEGSGRFSLSLLGDDQVDLARRGGRTAGTDDKFDDLGVTVVEGPDGTPAVAEAQARFWCRVVDAHPAGDHRLVLGQVEAYDRSGIDAPEARPALIRFLRRYASLGRWLTDETPGGYPT